MIIHPFCLNILKGVHKWRFYSTKNGIKSTIFAVSSGLGKCGVTVIRVSGPGVKLALSEIGGFKALPQPRRAELRKIRDPQTKDVLDHGLIFWFPSPKSFTGEDCCEFQVHGSTAVVTSVLTALSKLENFRPAEAGEFTRRAFYSGKMDLTTVEGLSALIASETEIQRKHALYQLSGSLFSLYSEWAEKLLKCLAYIEAHIDFDEDQDIDKNVLDEVSSEVSCLIEKLKSHIEDGRRGERIREGVQMTIVGAPNSGKSSLLNSLSKRPAAIVSSIPGTTRDIVQTHLDLNGYPINVADTAGLRSEPSDQIEEEGISRAIESVKSCDLILVVMDIIALKDWATRKHIKTISQKYFSTYLEQFLSDLAIKEEVKQCTNLKDFFELNSCSMSNSTQGLFVLNKVDLLSSREFIGPEFYNSDCVSVISCKTGDGMDRLLQLVTKRMELLCGSSSLPASGFSRPYQRHCLEECLSSLQRYMETVDTFSQADLSAQHLRQALTAIGKITGRVSPEQLLDVIFRDFCIGK